LVGVHHIPVARRAPGIARLAVPVLAQLARRIDRLTELADNLLHGLSGEAGIAPARPALPARLGGPMPVQAADALVALHHIAPQACCLAACCPKCRPLCMALGHPVYLYRPISHALSILYRSIEHRLKPLKPLYPRAEAPGLYG